MSIPRALIQFTILPFSGQYLFRRRDSLFIQKNQIKSFLGFMCFHVLSVCEGGVNRAMAGEEVFIDRLFSVGLSFVPCMMRTFTCLDNGPCKRVCSTTLVRVVYEFWMGREKYRGGLFPPLCVKSNR